MGERHIGEAVRRVAQQVAAANLNAVWSRVQNDPVDEAALRELVDHWGPGFLGYCGAALGDGHAAEDVVSAAFANLIRRRAVPTDAGAALRYMWKTVARAARRARWRVARRPDRTSLSREMESADPGDSNDPSAHAERAEVVADVSAAIGNLSSNERCALVLVAFLGQTENEAAGVMECSRSSVSKYLARAREKLGQLLVRWKDSVAVSGGVAAVDTVLTSTARAGSIRPAMIESILRQAAVPAFSVSSWAMVTIVLLALATVGGIAVAVWPAAAPEHAPVAAFTPIQMGPTETLQEKNLRIARDEIASPLGELLQRFYPPPYQVRAASIRALGSEVEIEFQVTPPPPAVIGLAARLRGRYCLVLQRLTVSAQPLGQSKWYWMDPDRPLTLKLPVPFGLQLEMVRGREEFAAAQKLFAQLPQDERAEPDQIRTLFGVPRGKIHLPAETRGVSGFPGGLVAETGDGGLYVRDVNAWWRSAGKCSGWQPVIADGQVYCYMHGMIQSRRVTESAAPWEKWCDEPPLLAGDQRHGQLFVAGGRLCMTVEPHGLNYRPLMEPNVGWTRSSHTLNPTGIAEVGETLFGNDGKRLFKRPAAQPDAAWVPVGPWPDGYSRMFADGNCLVAYHWGPGPILRRAASAGPDDAWTEVGMVHDPYKR